MEKHTTFVVEDKVNLTESKKFGNIEVVTLNTHSNTSDSIDKEDRCNLLSATIGSTSKSSSLFARDNFVCGSKEQSCESRKRRSKDDEWWVRSKKMVVGGGGLGRPAVLFK